MKFSIILSIIFLSSFGLFAQDLEKPAVVHCTTDPGSFSTTLIAGPAWSWYDFSRNPYTASSSSPGYAIGLRKEYRVNPYLGFGIEGEIIHTNYSFESRYDANGYNERVEDAFKHNLTATMASVPVYMKVFIPHTEKVSYYALGGIGMEVMIGGTSEVQQVLPTQGEPSATASKSHLIMPTNGFLMPLAGYYTFGIGSEIKLASKYSLLIEVKTRSEINYRNYQYTIETPGGSATSFGIREHSLSLALGLKF